MEQLLKNGWQRLSKPDALQKEFTFTSFSPCFAMMTRVAMEAERLNHHPEWSNVYNRLTIKWTTHETGGISDRDLHMAQFCDQIY